jgi:hypothetical protein
MDGWVMWLLTGTSLHGFEYWSVGWDCRGWVKANGMQLCCVPYLIVCICGGMQGMPWPLGPVTIIR